MFGKKVVQAVSVLLGVGLVGLMVVRTSSAVFSGSTTNNGNGWTTGTVTLSDNRLGTAMFTVAGDGNLAGGATLTRCITVAYTGSIVTGTSVKLYAPASTGALRDYLDTTVEQGTGAQANCSDFAPTSTIRSTTALSTITTNNTTFGTGLGSWSPTATNQTMTYRFTVTVQNTANAQNKSATADFTWEALA